MSVVVEDRDCAAGRRGHHVVGSHVFETGDGPLRQPTCTRQVTGIQVREPATVLGCGHDDACATGLQQTHGGHGLLWCEAVRYALDEVCDGFSARTAAHPGTIRERREGAAEECISCRARRQSWRLAPGPATR